MARSQRGRAGGSLSRGQDTARGSVVRDMMGGYGEGTVQGQGGYSYTQTVPERAYVNLVRPDLARGIAELFADEWMLQISRVTRKVKRITRARRRRAGIAGDLMFQATMKLISEGFGVRQAGESAEIKTTAERPLNSKMLKRMKYLLPMLRTGVTTTEYREAMRRLTRMWFSNERPRIEYGSRRRRRRR